MASGQVGLPSPAGCRVPWPWHGVPRPDNVQYNVLLTAAPRPNRDATAADVGVSRTLHDNSRLPASAQRGGKSGCPRWTLMRLTVVPRLAVRLALRNQVARGRSRSSHVVFTFAESLDVCRDFTRSQRRRIVWSGEPPKLRCSTESEMTPCLSAFIFLTAAWR